MAAVPSTNTYNITTMTMTEQVLPCLNSILDAVTNIQREQRRNHEQLLREQKTSNAGIKTHLHILQERISRLDEKNIYVQSVQTHLNNNSTKGSFVDKTNINSNNFSHREVLRKHIKPIVDDINLKESSVLDGLIQDSVLSQDESEELLNDNCRRNINRKLVCKLSQRSHEKFTSFLKHIKEPYPHIYDDLKASTDAMTQMSSPNMCATCLIKRDVPMTHVIDKLYECAIIDMDIYNMISSNPGISDGPSLKGVWNCVLSAIDSSEDRKSKLRNLQHILYTKYEHCSAQLGLLLHHQTLECRCKTDDCNRSLTSISSYEISTTSSRIVRGNRESITSAEIESVASSEENPSFTNYPKVLDWMSSMVDSEGQDTNSFESEGILTTKPIKSDITTIHKLSANKDSSFRNIGQALLSKEDDERETLKTGNCNILAVRSAVCEIQEASLSSFEETADATMNKCKRAIKKTKRRRSKSIGPPLEQNLPVCEKTKALNRGVICLIDNPAKKIEEMLLHDKLRCFQKTDIIANETPDTSSTLRIHIADTDNAIHHASGSTSSPSSSDKTESATSSPDTNNNPKYVTDVKIITSSKKVNPLLSGVPTSSEQTLSKKQRRGEKNRRKKKMSCS